MEKLDRRDRRFLAACAAAIVLGALVTGALFRRAFPEASIEFRVNRTQARALGERLLAERGRDVKGARFAGEFDVDDAAKVYLERELGLERASRVYGREVRIWQWRMRWFRSGVKAEDRVAVSPLGALIDYHSILPEDAPGARLAEGEARALALRELAARGLAADALSPIEATPVARPNRSDWNFVFEKKGVRWGDATLRYEATVSGDRVTAYGEFLHVPEAWTRDYQRLRSKNEAAGQVATFALFATLLAMLAVLVRKIVLKDVRWGLVAGFGGAAVLLQLLSQLNELPLALYGYDTASPLSAYLTNRVVVAVLLAVATGAGIAIVVASAEPIYRERFPRPLSLSGAFSLPGIRTREFLRSVALGYALVAFFFAYQAVFYVVADHFGAWAPADVPYSDMLNTAFPWVEVLLIGFLPAVSEEGISRMFSISFLDRLGAGRFVAVVVPAFIWGFGHSTYPNQPFYIRGVEVGCAGVVIGLVFLRYGVLPLLVWHFTVDALYTALVLLRSGNTYYVVSGAVAAFILVLPLLASVVVAARRGGFRSTAGLTNGDTGFVPEPPRTALTDEAAASVRPLPRGILAFAAIAAALLASSFLVPADGDRPLVEDATGRAEAEAIAGHFLKANGADPARWSTAVYTGTGFPYDQSVREARPQDASGVPGFSDAAARYVIEQGGVAGFRRLAERQLPLAYWVVRFYRPESKEEWKVLLDARRARVVAFVHPIGEDAAEGPPVPEAAARRRAAAAAGLLGYPAGEYSVLEVGTEARPKRVDTTVVLESRPPGVGRARPRLTAVFHGPRLASFLPSIDVPEDYLREQRRRTSAEVVLTAVRVLAAGSLVGVAVVLFLRRVREPDFRWRRLFRPLAWTALVAGAGLANTWPALFRVYDTEKPMTLFRLGLVLSLTLSLAAILVAACLGFVLLGAARPGWPAALRRSGSFGDALVRAVLSVAIAAGLARWFHVIALRVPSLYEPDPALPGSLATAVPGIDAVWSAARGAFVAASIAAAAVLAWRSAFFRTRAGRVLGAAAIGLALVPSELRSGAGFGFELLSGLLFAAWAAVCAFGLLRDHAAAWALFGILAFGGRVALELLDQPAGADRGAGAVAAVLLGLAALVLFSGRRRESPPGEPALVEGFSAPSAAPPASSPDPAPEPGSPTPR